VEQIFINEEFLMEVESKNENGEYGEDAKKIIESLLGSIRHLQFQLREWDSYFPRYHTPNFF
jgi:hypothetical protein